VSRNDQLVDEVQDPATVRFFIIRGLTIPAIFLISIGVSYFSIQAAVYSWFILILVDAVVLRRKLSR
jgi:hypothetical protein